MSILKEHSEIKIKEEVSHNSNQPQSDHFKEESEMTQPPQEPKVKVQTKVPFETKKETQKKTEYSLQSISSSKKGLSRGFTVKRRKRNLSQYTRAEDVRTVAINFIEHGLNFRLFSETYPQIDAKFYRNTVEAINNTSINEIQKFLNYENNIMIQKLNRDQKRSIRTQLTKVREWLGKRDIGQLQTLYKFIQRKFLKLDVSITIEEALKFYKTILQIVKSPFVDVMEDQIKPQKFDPNASKKAQIEQKETQQKAMIILYLQHRNLGKVSDLLCEKFGYNLSRSKHAVMRRIIRILAISLKKLIASVDAYDSSLPLYFSESQECVDLINKCEASYDAKDPKKLLLEFYLQNTVTLLELRESVRMLNKFFIQNYKSHGEYKCKKFEEDMKIPKLQIKNEKTEKNLTEESHELKLTNCKTETSYDRTQILKKAVKEQQRDDNVVNQGYNQPIKEENYEVKGMEEEKDEGKKEVSKKRDLKKNQRPVQKSASNEEKNEFIIVYDDCLTDSEDIYEVIKYEPIKLEN